MSTKDGFYSGLVAPRWNEIDKIHYGAAATLNPEDEIFLGRYVLVKYTEEFVYSQDRKFQMIDADIDGLSDNDKQWRQCYDQDGADYDGVVFKKVADDSAIKYVPVAQLSTSYTINSVKSLLGPSFENGDQTVESYIIQANANTLAGAERYTDEALKAYPTLDYVNGQVKDAKAYTDEEIAKAIQGVLGEGLTETYDTLVEIEKWITGDGVDATELTTAVADEANKRESEDVRLQDEINNKATISSLNATNSTVSGHTTQIADINKNISELSRMGLVEKTELPDINDAQVSVIYKIYNGGHYTLYYVELIEDGTKTWKEIGAAQPIMWKEF